MTQRVTRYEEIAQYLRELVATGEPGDRLPSDTELAERFGVSRMTARHAVQVLANERLLHREQGRGTFVSDRPVPRLLGSALSFTESMRIRGLTASSRILDVATLPASATDAAALGVGDGQPVTVLTRLRLADGVPMAIERAVLAPDLAVDVASEDSLHAQFEALGRHPEWARARVTARLATPDEAQQLELDEPTVILHENRVIYDDDNRPLEHTETWYAAERYVFDAVMTRADRP